MDIRDIARSHKERADKKALARGATEVRLGKKCFSLIVSRKNIREIVISYYYIMRL